MHCHTYNLRTIGTLTPFLYVWHCFLALLPISFNSLEHIPCIHSLFHFCDVGVSPKCSAFLAIHYFELFSEFYNSIKKFLSNKRNPFQTNTPSSYSFFQLLLHRRITLSYLLGAFLCATFLCQQHSAHTYCDKYIHLSLPAS